MYKIPTPKWLLSRALIVAVVCLFLSGVSGCGPGEGDKGKPQINEDTLRNHVIPIGLAIKYTKAFRATLDSTTNRLRPKAIDSITFSHAEEFPSDVFYSLLAQSNEKQGNAKGIRIYLGRDTSGQLKLVLVPVDSLGNDIINHLVNQQGKPVPGTAHIEAATSGGQGYEAGQVCPTVCSSAASGLNQ
ncbi:hypothetical protein [Puia dinghuensis]|uniref:Uncharacterized protein n=1 Tax=Puia dinghuensis TaxID=1792502 RepID=A0A8J2UGX5_9BACT|nr:hypothetical protein [Puia dinghuensis]GGB14191.1 hypothetical protein GCM10011511_42460 [Puia dinghuensis]